MVMNNFPQSIDNLSLSNNGRPMRHQKPYGQGGMQLGLNIPQDSYHVYIQNLPPGMTDSKLEGLIGALTTAPTTARVLPNPSNSKSLFGFVKFNSPEEAIKAVDDCTFNEIENHVITAKLATDYRVPEPNSTIYIRGIPPHLRVRSLYDIVSELGTVVSIKIPTARKKDKEIKLNFGKIQFLKETEADAAIHYFNTCKIKGQQIYAEKFLSFEDIQKKKKAQVSTFMVLKFIPLTLTKDELLDELKMVEVARPEDSSSEKGDSDNKEEKSKKPEWEDSVEEGQIAVSRFELKEPKPNLNYTLAFFLLLKKEQKPLIEENLKALNSKLEKAFSEAPGQEEQKGFKEIQLQPALSKLELRSMKKEEERQNWKKMKGRNIFVKGLPSNLTKEEFTELCAKFGEIESINLPMEAKPSTSSAAFEDAEDQEETNIGYGFVCYKTKEEAEKAIEELEGMFLGIKTLSACLALSPTERAKEQIKQVKEASNRYPRRPYYPYYPSMGAGFSQPPQLGVIFPNTRDQGMAKMGGRSFGLPNWNNIQNTGRPYRKESMDDSNEWKKVVEQELERKKLAFGDSALDLAEEITRNYSKQHIQETMRQDGGLNELIRQIPK